MGSCLITRVAEVVTVVVAVVEGWVEAGDGEAVGGEGGPAEASCCNSVVLVAFSCCCFFFTSCSADLRSSSVTPATKHWFICFLPLARCVTLSASPRLSDPLCVRLPLDLVLLVPHGWHKRP